MSFVPEPSRITAVLGPTNTGKTHLAIERMLGHGSGMIGFPLRLLARENYDRIVRLRGAASVALITGEERIIPAHPRWFVCTVEAMPLNRLVDFLAIDEIQLAADPDRGHVFTDRLLHARGRSETMFLGAETIRSLIQRLIPDAEVITRPRLSKLTYSGPRKLTRLPRRSAVVAFSAQDVYSIAELIRRTRGGAAVVLGALSPRTRNAQVALFQAGEVDHLVATDAIGMGLNMQIDHVAFAAMRKFDGRAPRGLTSAEVAQIGGRAGRHLNDGTFGTTGDVGGIDPEIVEQVENHEFPPLQGIYWRNPNLTFTSLEGLQASLAIPPRTTGLIRTRPADDQRVLEVLAREPDIAHRARGLGQLRLLWEVCQIPDFRKVQPETHARLVGQIFRHLTAGTHRLPTDWLAGHLAALDRADGDMHALMDRIASIRVWTYVSQRGQWVDDATHWQERSRAIEDMLSDALHERLTQRFVDVRTSVLAKRLRDGDALTAAVSDTDTVTVEGLLLGHLEGLTFLPDHAEGRSATRAVQNAAEKALRGEIARRVARLTDDEDDAFTLTDDGDLMWRGSWVARLHPGTAPLQPQIDVPQDSLLIGDQRDRVSARLQDWLSAHLQRVLAPLLGTEPDSLSGPARGLLFQVCEALGTAHSAQAREQIAALSDTDRKVLARLGIRLGRLAIYVPALFKPVAQQVRALLWSLYRRCPVPDKIPHGQMSLPVPEGLSSDLAFALGYRVMGTRLVRVDGVETVAAALRHRLRHKDWSITKADITALIGPLGVPATEHAAVFAGLGWTLSTEGDDETSWTVRPMVRQSAMSGRRGTGHAKSRSQSDTRSGLAGAAEKSRGSSAVPSSRRRSGQAVSIDPDAPFAALRDHVLLQQPQDPPKPAKPAHRHKGQKARIDRPADSTEQKEEPTAKRSRRRSRRHPPAAAQGVAGEPALSPTPSAPVNEAAPTGVRKKRSRHRKKSRVSDQTTAQTAPRSPVVASPDATPPDRPPAKTRTPRDD